MECAAWQLKSPYLIIVLECRRYPCENKFNELKIDDVDNVRASQRKIQLHKKNNDFALTLKFHNNWHCVDGR